MENTLLIFDSTLTIALYNINISKSKKIYYGWIPKWLRPILQPSDVCINKPFKYAIKHKNESSVIFFSDKNNIKFKQELKWRNE